MKWLGFNINGKFKDLSHLNPFSMTVTDDNVEIELNISFFNHCFTDEKGGERMPFKNEERYWSEDRYLLSRQLPDLIKNNFKDKYAVVYRNKKGSEQYHYMEVFGYAVFFDINKPAGTENNLKIKIISAYELDDWGKSSLPKGKAKKIKWIIGQRNKNLSAL